jgi:hypothetical protein
MRTPFRLKGRAGWYAEVEHADGRAERRGFEAHKDAVEWLDVEREKARAAQEPLFGGPSGLTLGQMLGEYAARFTVNKGGYAAELSRINHYVVAVGLPRLKVRIEGEKRFLETVRKQDTPHMLAPTEN